MFPGRCSICRNRGRCSLPSTRLLLPLRGLRHADAGGISRGRCRAGAIWQADRRICALSAALPVAAREASGRTHGTSLRCASGHRDHRPDQPGLCGAIPGLCRCRARPRRGGTCQAHGRNRLPDWRQDAVAAHRLDHLAHFLPCLAAAWQPAGTCHGHCRARPLEAGPTP